MPKIKQIKNYTKENGKEPFTLWLESLDKRLKAKVTVKIKYLQVGNYSNCSILKNADGVKEARIKTASGIRIYFAEDNEEIIILLAGGDKDTQDNDIQKAKEYWQDYKQRRNTKDE